MHAAERSSKLDCVSFVQRFVVDVAKPKIAVSSYGSAAVFRHPAAAMESMSPNTDSTGDLSFSISR
jgi:hypothetical protein